MLRQQIQVSSIKVLHASEATSVAFAIIPLALVCKLLLTPPIHFTSFGCTVVWASPLMRSEGGLQSGATSIVQTVSF